MEKLMGEKLFEKFSKWKKWCPPFKQLLQKKRVKYIKLIENMIHDMGEVLFCKKQKVVDSNNLCISTSFNHVDFNKFQSRGFQQVSDVKKFEALNALSFYFKQINDNLDSFTNSSSSNKHCTTMHTDLETFNCRKQRNFFKEQSNVTFSKKKLRFSK